MSIKLSQMRLKLKNTLQDMLVTKEENQKERNGEVKNTLQDMLVTDEGNQKDTNDDRAVLPWNSNPPPTQLDPESVTKTKKKRKRSNERENGAKPERKRKERADKKFPQTYGDSHNNAIKEEEGKQDEDKSTSLDPVVSVQEEQNQKQQRFVTLNVDQSFEESHSKKKMKRKRRNEENKESRTRESMEASNGINA
ncbi:PEPTIDYL-PROLYL CIS-TRANS ISOMERASE FKBP53-LIKE [Salix koriyanagi]|uniref:PEPTIDYL-PROLYL CIS-TRANS ISOMERASE FKBP53-LIKE n=1 Tax=Salix koriyanagi TaxID=2511006 RepID=A0A9Q0ZFH9_9ROSI|nr:PEPTIDYL-PROLYL CIS-TRANS ISOMERASE FKBP53-LIKE [Salix koriyanagi]